MFDGTAGVTNVPLPANTVVPSPFKSIVAMLPIPLTLATATLFAVAANATSPETLAPATAFADAATVADATVPVMFAAVMFDKLPPSPMILPPVTLPGVVKLGA